jgi:hypothetical protein
VLSGAATAAAVRMTWYDAITVSMIGAALLVVQSTFDCLDNLSG